MTSSEAALAAPLRNKLVLLHLKDDLAQEGKR